MEEDELSPVLSLEELLPPKRPPHQPPEPSLLAEIARQVDDARLGLCLDVGHANTFVSHVPPLEWIAPMAPWLRHVHIHDNAGQMDLHDPLGKGVIQMERVLDEIVRLAPAATFTIENQDCAPSIDWLRQKGYLGDG